jgi:hypothetical protein
MEILRFKEDYYPIIISMESLNPAIIDEEDKINLVTYCTFTSNHVVKDDEGVDIKLINLEEEKHTDDIATVKN